MIRTFNLSVLAVLVAVPAFSDEALLNCRHMEDASARVACYDRLVDARFPAETAEIAPRVHTPNQLQGKQVDSDTSPTQPKVTQAPAPVAEAPVTEAPAVEESNDSEDLFGKPSQLPTDRPEINATVQNVTKSAHKKLLVTLDNEQVWRQVDSSTMRLHAGDTVTIRTSSFNSYQLRKQSGGKSIRVKRID